MQLYELYDSALDGYQNVEDDQSKITKDDLRKTRLTLMQLNKLRQMNDIRNYEQAEKIKEIQLQYSAPAEQAAPPY